MVVARLVGAGVVTVGIAAVYFGCEPTAVSECPMPCGGDQVCALAPAFSGDCPDGGVDGGPCPDTEQVCVDMCDDASPCPHGHRCVAEKGACSPECEVDLCFVNETCEPRTRACIRMDCSNGVACPMPDYCETQVFACYPQNGTCNGVPCRPTPDIENAHATVTCSPSALFCILQRKAAPRPPGLSAPESLPLNSPAVAQVYAVETDITFSWQGQPATVFVYVLKDMPDTLGDIPRLALWAVSVPPNIRSVAWNEGYTVQGDRWVPPAPAAPHNVPLYYFVEAVSAEGLLASSAFVPFSIGDAWRATGAPCQDEGVVAGSCDHPSLLRSCTNGVCTLICESNLDCTDPRFPTCLTPNAQHLRTCGPTQDM